MRALISQSDVFKPTSLQLGCYGGINLEVAKIHLPVGHLIDCVLSRRKNQERNRNNVQTSVKGDSHETNLEENFNLSFVVAKCRRKNFVWLIDNVLTDIDKFVLLLPLIGTRSRYKDLIKSCQ